VPRATALPLPRCRPPGVLSPLDPGHPPRAARPVIAPDAAPGPAIDDLRLAAPVRPARGPARCAPTRGAFLPGRPLGSATGHRARAFRPAHPRYVRAPLRYAQPRPRDRLRLWQSARCNGFAGRPTPAIAL